MKKITLGFLFTLLLVPVIKSGSGGDAVVGGFAGGMAGGLISGAINKSGQSHERRRTERAEQDAQLAKTELAAKNAEIDQLSRRLEQLEGQRQSSYGFNFNRLFTAFLVVISLLALAILFTLFKNKKE